MSQRFTLGAEVVTWGRTWDPAGRLASVTGPAGTTAYAYDHAGQLATVRNNGAVTATYAYDALGRRTRSTDPSGTFEYAYDPAGRLVARTTPDADYPLSVKAQVNGQTVGTLAGHRPGDATYAYDAQGRRTTRTAPEGTTAYAWGPDGRLATAATAPLTTRYAYDPAGRLGAVTVEDGTPDTTRLAWDDSGVPALVQLADARGTVELVGGPDGLLGITTNAGPSLVPTDHLGSPLSTAATASFVPSTGYGPFGEPSASRPDPTLGYRGELQIGSLLHLRARDYDPVSGGFTSRDPLDGVDATPTVANAYHYADNDPLDRVDPTGLRSKDIDLECVKAAAALVPVEGLGGGAVLPSGSPVLGVGGPVILAPSPGVRIGSGGAGINCLKPGTKPGKTRIGAGLAAAIVAALGLAGTAIWFSRINDPGEEGGGGRVGSDECSAPQTSADPNCTDHPGRIQVQGDDVAGDISWAWVQATPPTAQEALTQLAALEASLSRRQREVRTEAFRRAADLIQRCQGAGGCTAPLSQSFQNRNLPANLRNARVDIEIITGRAFT